MLSSKHFMTKCVNTCLVSSLTCDDQLCWRRMVYQDLAESLWTLPMQSQSVYSIQRTESLPLDLLPTSHHEHYARPFWCFLLLAFRGSLHCYSAGPTRRPLWNIATEYHQTETKVIDKSMSLCSVKTSQNRIQSFLKNAVFTRITWWGPTNALSTRLSCSS